MKNQIVIGTRGSKLALWQADYVERRLREEYPGLFVTQKRVTTKGDRILDVPLAKIGGKGLFTKELEEEMLSGEIDLAVHSLKDMPASVPEGLVIAAVTKRLDPGDALVSNRFSSFAELPPGARVGTSSLRRRAQLLCARPDLTMIDLRGNVNTRLRKLDEGEYDAIVLAVAGLKRLGFADRIREVLPRDMLLPAVGQGALAIETRAGDQETRDMLAFLRDDDTVCCAEAERSFLARVEGGCQVPVGVYATAEGDGLTVEAVIASLDGQRAYRGAVKGARKDAAALGKNLAERLLAEGGAEILKELGLLGGE
ncbi:MAG: hydroxymethylbilane synthase [Schwartzia sp.]|nr:hydroxymethylbilane synthase [Schwartzia sp. (in: firmicutes)]